MENTFQGNLIWRLNEKHKDSSVMTLSEHRFFDRYPQVYLTCLMAGHRILVDPRETSLPPTAHILDEVVGEETRIAERRAGYCPWSFEKEV